MLFNSDAFIFGFFPIALLGFLVLARAERRQAAIAFLALASLAFYSWWNPRHLPLLLGSIAFNHAIGSRIARMPQRGWLVFGIASNLALLGVFKYAAFGLELTGIASSFSPVLPLAISFFTFQQIAFLVDSYRGFVPPCRLLDYGLFVAFFPQLIAGPIVRCGELLGQLRQGMFERRRADDVAVGGTLFVFGLAKKVVVADTLARYVGPAFDLAASGGEPPLLECWFSLVAYALQIYFDFSGYSDMALGLARCFGIHLPVNFDSPYKATSIVDFWRRWHITLSRFLRDYLYIPLGGNRNGPARRHLNLMITMLLGGLWHGAGMQFVVWGGLHGTFLVANHGWRALHVRSGILPRSRPWTRAIARGLTFVAVLVAWSFFRADSIDTAATMLRGMLGAHGTALHAAWIEKLGVAGEGLVALGIVDADPRLLPSKAEFALLGAVLAIAMLAPNTQQILPVTREERRIGPDWSRWQPTLRWGVATGAIAGVAVIFLSRMSEFLYFRF